MKTFQSLILLVWMGFLLFSCSKNDDGTGTPEDTNPPLSYLELYPAKMVTKVGQNFEYQIIARDLNDSSITDIKPKFSDSNMGLVRIEGIAHIKLIVF